MMPSPFAVTNEYVENPGRLVFLFLAAILCLIAAWYLLGFNVRWSFNHIEQHTKKAISATELQHWAENILLHQPPSKNGDFLVHRSELVAPLPAPLLKVYHNSPDIFVFPAMGDSPGYIRLMWGGGMIGHCGFEIGPTNFVSSRQRGKWQDGVYFWADP